MSATSSDMQVFVYYQEFFSALALGFNSFTGLMLHVTTSPPFAWKYFVLFFPFLSLSRCFQPEHKVNFRSSFRDFIWNQLKLMQVFFR